MIQIILHLWYAMYCIESFVFMHAHSTIDVSNVYCIERAKSGYEFDVGLARTMFMEDRAKFGLSIDIQGSFLPSVNQLAQLACESGEYAVAIRGGRLYGLRLLASPIMAAPRHCHDPKECVVVSGGSQVSIISFQCT
jgi:hypothetical protein